MIYQYIGQMQTGWSQYQGMLKWALFLATTCLPKAQRFCERKIQTYFFQVSSEGLFMATIVYPWLQLVKE